MHGVCLECGDTGTLLLTPVRQKQLPKVVWERTTPNVLPWSTRMYWGPPADARVCQEQVPKVVWERTTPNVLTMEYADVLGPSC